MKVRITLKDPDGVYDSLNMAVKESLGEAGITDGGEVAALFGVRRARVERACSKFIDYEEYVTIEIDTDAGTAVVIPVKEN